MLVIAFVGAAAGWFVYRSTMQTIASDDVTEREVRNRVDDWLMGSPLHLSAEQIGEAESSVRTWVSSGFSSFGFAQATLVVQLLGGAILATVLTFFLLIGAVVAGATAALVALVAVGPSTALWVIVLTLVVQQFEGNVMQPMIVARKVSIHPVVVLVSLAAGGAVAGLAGAFLAVPVVASALAAVRALSADMDSDTDSDTDSASEAAHG